MSDEEQTAEQTEEQRRDAIIRKLVAESSTRLARQLIDHGFDRTAVVLGFRDTCEALRDDALAEIKPEGHA